MEYFIKNIILYDVHGSVAGFAECKIRPDHAHIKVRQNYVEKDLAVKVIADGVQIVESELVGVQSNFEVRMKINPEREIFVSLTRAGQETASGIINPGAKNGRSAREVKGAGSGEGGDSDGSRSGELNDVEIVQISREMQVEAEKIATKEVDDVLRQVCQIDESGKGQCESCPYREYFYQFTLDHDRNVRTEAAATTGMFFDIVKNQIENILSSNKPCSFLNEAIENSRFVCVPRMVGEEYAVGVIYDDNGAPRYLCSAVYAANRNAPRPEFSGNAQWLAKNPEFLNGDGYWISYQDAASGEQIALS